MNKSKFERFIENLMEFARERGLYITQRGVTRNELEIVFYKISDMDYVAKFVVPTDDVTDWYRIEYNIKADVSAKLAAIKRQKEEKERDSFMVMPRGSGRSYYTRMLETLSYVTNSLSVIPAIEKVIFNEPATIVFWSDGTKTVVKAQDGDKFDKEKGLVMAITKKAFGNEGNYYDKIKKWVE